MVRKSHLPAHGAAPQPLRILAVDDSPSIRTLVQSVLGGAGYQVELAVSGEQAIERALAAPPDLVVSDVTMGAISGVQLCRLLKAEPVTAHIPVVLLTAAEDPRSKFWGRTAGASAYVTKKSLLEKLLPEVQRVLAARAPVSAPPPSNARRVDPFTHLSRVLDELLFQAIVSAEVRRLLDRAGDRHALARELLTLASEVTEVACAAVILRGPLGETLQVFTRRPAPADLHSRLCQARGLLCPPLAGEPLCEEPAGTPDQLGPGQRFQIVAGAEPLGELLAFAGGQPLKPADIPTLELLVREVAVVIKAAFLTEDSRQKYEELAAAQNKVVRLEKLALAAELAGGIAHEINNPLSWVRAGYQSLRDTVGDLRQSWQTAEAVAEHHLQIGGEEGARLVARMRASEQGKGQVLADLEEIVHDGLEGVERVGDLVRGFRRLATHPPAGEPAPLDVVELTTQCVAELRNSVAVPRRPLALETSPTEQASCVRDDLHSALHSLLSFLCARARQNPELLHSPLTVALEPIQRAPTLLIVDPSLNLSSEARDRLFDPRIAADSESGRHMRLDISLALALQLLHRNRAELSVEEAPQGGTRFRVALRPVS